MYPHFTALPKMPKTFHSTVSLQVRLFDSSSRFSVSVLFSFFM